MTAGDASGRMLQILLVDDSLTDADLAREALCEGDVKNQLHHVRDGHEAMKFLRQKSPYDKAPRPDLVLLDLNMPTMSGQQVLSEIRSDPELKSLIVVVLTTSSEQADVQQAYRQNCNAFITKPVDFNEFVNVVKSLDAFWFQLATLPPNE